MKNKKIYKLSIALFVVMVLSITSVAHAGTLSVTRYEQEKSLWCWCAVAQMLGKYTTGTLYSQSNICTQIKGSATNVTANDLEISKAIKYTTGISPATSGKLSYSAIQNEIDNYHQPFAISMIWSLQAGHVLVVSGCGYGGQTLRLVDPASGCGTAWYNYEDLCNGTTVQSGTGYYAMTWSI